MYTAFSNVQLTLVIGWGCVPENLRAYRKRIQQESLSVATGGGKGKVAPVLN
jgi:hypothetical protein